MASRGDFIALAGIASVFVAPVVIAGAVTYLVVRALRPRPGPAV